MLTSLVQPATMLMQQQGEGPSAVFIIIYLVIVVVLIAALWKVFTKADKPGWASIIPIYQSIVMLQIVGRPGWWVILFFIPIVNLVIHIMVMLELAKVYGKGTGFGIGLILLAPIFVVILGFGDAEYQGPLAH